MKLTQMLLLLELLLLLLHRFLPLFLQWFKQLQQQKQQQLQQQQHLCLNEKLMLIQFNLISIDFVFLVFFKVNFARRGSILKTTLFPKHPLAVMGFSLVLSCFRSSPTRRRRSRT